MCSRSPYGERGLKSAITTNTKAMASSLPIRGAWIEIYILENKGLAGGVAPHTGSVD